MPKPALAEILPSTSDALFPDRMGVAPVALDSRDADGDTAPRVAAALVDAGAHSALVSEFGQSAERLARERGIRLHRRGR